MKAIGFGQNVTGGGQNPNRIKVTKGGKSGPDTLAEAIKKANDADGRETEIVIQTNIDPNPDELVIRARNLTIRAESRGVEGRYVINRNLLCFKRADNIWLTDLRFDSDGKSEPRDTILIDATEGRGKKGFWIDHCSFEAYKDLNITSHTSDLEDEPPLLITLSHCRFHDRDHSGQDSFNHGGLTISGFDGESQKTNAYATVVRNFFQNVRRRSPRTSRLTFVHAFNNVLENWGNGDPNADPGADQVDAMAVGNFGILAAEANAFDAGAFKPTINVARDPEPGQLFVGVNPLMNLYRNGALPPPGTYPDTTPELRKRYRDALEADVPRRDPIENLIETIKREAGARP
jgi:pectate lyase